MNERHQTNTIVVLQARTGSRRLPAKALLSFRGYPLAILAALRAGTRGHKVLLATSDHASDDLLAATALTHGIECFRGPLEDVLGRFCIAIRHLPDSAIVVRLTGDNVVPDGELIAEVVEALRESDAAYISTGAAASGLPYGVSVEATYVEHLRAADIFARTDFEREHVTPWIRANRKTADFENYAFLSRTYHRTTVDTIDDVASLHRVFPDSSDPVNVPWREIVERVSLGLYQPGADIVGGDLVLGAAQLGMAYGVARAGSPSPAEGRELLRQAIVHGVKWVDTARAYGRSEAVIGQVLGAGWEGRCRVVTKLSPLPGWGDTDSPRGARAAAEVSLRASLEALQVRRIDTLLLHRASHWRAWGGAVADLLKEWQANGRIGTLGVSVQSPIELQDLIQAPEIGHIQMPFNILDWRWDAVIPDLVSVRSSRPLTVHLRSALLQGLLVSDDPSHWARAHVDSPDVIRGWLKSQAHALSIADVVALGLNWCRSQPWSDGVVVGMDSLAQLRHNLAIFSAESMMPTALRGILLDRPILDPKTLDPAQWKAETDVI